MYIDQETVLADAQVVTGTAPSANYMNLGAEGSGGNGKPFCLTVKEAALGAATVEFQLQSDDNAAFSTPKVVASTGAIAVADLALGKQVYLQMPVGGLEKYLRGNFVVAGGSLTAGKFTVGVVEAPQSNVAFASVI